VRGGVKKGVEGGGVVGVGFELTRLFLFVVASVKGMQIRGMCVIVEHLWLGVGNIEPL